MENKLTIEVISAYLPYGVRFQSTMDKPEEEYGKQPVWTARGIDILFGDYCITTAQNSDAYAIGTCKLHLRPLSDLTKEIEHNGERFVPIEYFEIGDDDNYTYEFDSGNVKLIKTLETISKHNLQFDIKFLPFEVVKTLISWHFDTQNMIQDGLAIDINTLEK